MIKSFNIYIETYWSYVDCIMTTPIASGMFKIDFARHYACTGL